MNSDLDEGLLLNSKKIQKVKVSSPKNEKKSRAKQYNTFADSVKANILSELRTELNLFLSNSDLNQHFAELSHEFELNQLIKLAKNNYPSILKRIVRKYDPSFTEDSKCLGNWRGKILSWIRRTGKPETRGGGLVADENMSFFLLKLKAILSNLKTRDFKDLKREIISVLEEIHLRNGNSLESFNRNVCSPHWWLTFTNKNLDIKVLWKSLKITRKSKYQEAERETHIDTNSMQSSLLSSICSSPVYLPGSTFDEMEEETLRVITLLRTIKKNPKEICLLSEETATAFNYLHTMEDEKVI